MIRQTSEHVAEQRSALVSFLRTETKRWRRYVRLRAGAIRSDAQGVFDRRGLERSILTRVEATLRDLDGRVRGRLRALDKKRRTRKPRRSTGHGAVFSAAA